MHRKRAIKSEAGKISGKALVGIAVAVLLVGCGVFFFTQSTNSTSSPLAGIVKAPLNPKCELNDPELCKFINNWPNVKSYTIISTTNDATGVKSESIFEIAGDNKSHILMKADGKDSYETITIDKTTYTKDYTDNKWWKQTYEPEKVDEFVKETMKETTFDDTKAVEDKTTYKSLGKEACGDLQCFKYQIVYAEDTGTTDLMWFDDKDYLMRKQSTKDSEGNTSESIYTYGSIAISEPSPIKEGSAADMYTPQMSAEEKAQLEQIKKDYDIQMESMPEEYQGEY